MRYTELQVTSNFSFLRGASHPHELVTQAAHLGYQALAITDRNSLAGIVRAHAAAKQHGIRLIPGCRLDLADGPSLLAYPTSKDAYANLCNLLTVGNRRTEKGKCLLYKADVYQYAEGLKFILLPPEKLNAEFELDASFVDNAKEYRAAFGAHLYLAVTRRYRGQDQKIIFRLRELSTRFDIPLVATNDVHYHHPARRKLQDVLTCIREKCTIREAGFRLHPNAERHLKSQEEMQRLFRQYPDTIRRTHEIAEACTFSLDEIKYEYPEEFTTEGRTPHQQLAYLSWEGARQHFGNDLPEKVRATLHMELSFIERKNYASYFLTVHDLVSFARSRNILCQGRGSAANSVVCYVLGITSVNPMKFRLLFSRFMSDDRNEPPDIDIDFENSRREEVFQYIYEKYGRDRAAIVGTVTQQRLKGALRDVGKAMGLSLDMINRLSSCIWHSETEALDKENLLKHGLDPGDRQLQSVLQLTKAFMGFPRQLGQHTGGFVISKGRLSDLVPILNARMENRTCIEWNKDDIDALGMMKVDGLALGMLTCLHKAFDLAKEQYGIDLTLGNIPQEAGVYEMISKGDSIGLFQIESRAQQNMLPKMRPREFYDLVIEIAIIRPGPIQGQMIHPYLRRRNGEEPVEYPSKEFEEILGRTLGIPLFQEQVMEIAIIGAGFTPSEANALRTSMATFKLNGLISKFEERLISGMTSRGYPLDYATRIYKQLEGFGSYGFPESHAASFALMVYDSAWLKWKYPDIFACALLNSQPMGFWAVDQIIRDAQRHGVEIRGIDINYSGWDNTLEPGTGKYKALRLGFRQIKRMRVQDIERLVAARKEPYTRIGQLRNIGLSDAALEKLADADAFHSLSLNRREALWQVMIKDTPTDLFKGQEAPDGKHEKLALPQLTAFEDVLQDYAATALSTKGHPVTFIREKLNQLYVLTVKDLATAKNGDMVRVAGIPIIKQRPETAKGTCFITLEDETGMANIIAFEKLFNAYRHQIMQSSVILVDGILQVEENFIHVIGQRFYNASKLFGKARPGR